MVTDKQLRVSWHRHDHEETFTHYNVICNKYVDNKDDDILYDTNVPTGTDTSLILPYDSLGCIGDCFRFSVTAVEETNSILPYSYLKSAVLLNRNSPEISVYNTDYGFANILIENFDSLYQENITRFKIYHKMNDTTKNYFRDFGEGINIDGKLATDTLLAATDTCWIQIILKGNLSTANSNKATINQNAVISNKKPGSIKEKFSVYPNPFNSQSTFHYSLAEPAQICIEIFDIMGRKVKTLVKRHYSKGSYSVIWDTGGYNTIPVSSGIYIARMVIKRAETVTMYTEKILLIK